MLSRPVVMFSLLSTGPVFGGVHHIAPNTQCHEHPAATHSTGLDSSSGSVDSVEGHALRYLTNTHCCPEAWSKSVATQTYALEDGLPDGNSQRWALASNTACSPHSFGGRHTTSTPGCDFEHLVFIDQHEWHMMCHLASTGTHSEASSRGGLKEPTDEVCDGHTRMLACSIKGGAITVVNPMMLTGNRSFHKRIKASYQHQPTSPIP